MKLIVAFSAFVCATLSAPSKPIVVPDLHSAPVVAAPAAVVAAPVAVVSSQSHAQDELGQYSYSYSNPLSSKVETKTVDGVTRGGYSYLDSHGLVQSVNYVSDDVNGFRVAASNLPLGHVTPQHDEPLVAAEKAKAVAALHEAAAHEAAEAAIAHENEVSHGPVYVESVVAPSPTPAVFVPAAHEVHAVHSTPAPVVHQVHAVPSTPVHELHAVHTAPTVHDLHEVHAVHSAPTVHDLHDVHVVHSTPAPVVHEVHVTPAPVTYVSHAPSPSPAFFSPSYHASSPAPPPSTVAHVTPSAYSAPAEHAHSYATVELDSSDFPPPSPQVYFHPSSAAHSPSPSPLPTAAPVIPEEPTQVLVPSPSPSPVAYVAHEATAHVVAPAPVVPAVHAAPAPVVPLAHETPVLHAAPAVSHAVPAAVVAAPVAVVSSQSHAQDELGQYSYSYSNPLSSKVETKTVDGITRGGYSYLDSHGLVQSVNYVSDDHNGFRVAASNLPTAAVPVDIPDSHDVAAAKHVFFAELAKAKAAADHPHVIEH